MILEVNYTPCKGLYCPLQALGSDTIPIDLGCSSLIFFPRYSLKSHKRSYSGKITVFCEFWIHTCWNTCKTKYTMEQLAVREILLWIMAFLEKRQPYLLQEISLYKEFPILKHNTNKSGVLPVHFILMLKTTNIKRQYYIHKFVIKHSPPPPPFPRYRHTRACTHTHTHTYIYIYWCLLIL